MLYVYRKQSNEANRKQLHITLTANSNHIIRAVHLILKARHSYNTVAKTSKKLYFSILNIKKAFTSHVLKLKRFGCYSNSTTSSRLIINVRKKILSWSLASLLSQTNHQNIVVVSCYDL